MPAHASRTLAPASSAPPSRAERRLLAPARPRHRPANAGTPPNSPAAQHPAPSSFDRWIRAKAPVGPKQADGLEERMEQLEADVAELRLRVETIQEVVGALQEDQARTLRQWEGRLVRVEAREVDAKGSGAASTPSVKGALEGPRAQPQVKPPRRPYPQLVTVEPEEGEELIYGEAVPAIAEWREARRTLEQAKRRLDKLDAHERMLELEVRLVGDHELTLPPAVYPWDRADRRDEVWRRKQSLQDLQVERSRALLWRWVRRVLTLGLWRK